MTRRFAPTPDVEDASAVSTRPAGASGSHVEQELTFDVPADRDLTDLVPGLEAVGLVAAESRGLNLRALYLDTPDLALARRGVVLRVRRGGDDDGWHVKLPGDHDDPTRARDRLELSWPAEETDGLAGPPPPKEALALLSPLLDDDDVSGLAEIDTERTELVVRDADGAVVATVTDDRVHGRRLRDPGGSTTWREWEVELAPETRDAGAVLRVLGEAIASMGGSRGAARSKLGRTVGEEPDPTSRRATSSAGELARRRIADLTERLRWAELRRRSGQDLSVHRLRTTVRRLRSALRTFGPVLGPRADELEAELRWLGHELGAARDADVVLAHVEDELDREGLAGTALAGFVEEVLRGDAGAGASRANHALDTRRHRLVLAGLDALASGPVPSPDDDVLKSCLALLHRDARRLHRAVRGAEDAATAGSLHAAALHDVRRKVKRLRYAAEALEPVAGRPARHLARRLRRVQDALGDHQDSVVVRDHLQWLAASATNRGLNAFALGRLHAHEEHRGEAAEAAYEALVVTLPRHPRRWLRRRT